MSKANRKTNIIPLFSEGLTPDFKNFFQSFLGAQADAICVYRENDGVVQFANQAFTKNFHINDGDVISNKNLAEFYDILVDQGLHEEVSVGDRSMDFQVTSFELKSTAYLVAAVRDVTAKVRLAREVIQKHKELKDLQEALVQAGKLAALGELTAGIGHEINQPLQIMKGYAQEAQERTKKLKAIPALSSKAQEDIKQVEEDLVEIESAVTRMERIIKSLRNFTSNSEKDFQMVQVPQAYRSAMILVGAQLRGLNIQSEEAWDPELTEVYANSTLLEQIFINFLTNARDAILSQRQDRPAPDRNAKIPTDQIIVRGKNILLDFQGVKRPFLEVQISDTGVGIASGIKSKIFNPFFTTKEVGKGMGLGLSLVQNMVSQLHGTVTFESTPGHGTTFFVRIPQDFRNF